MSVVHKFQLQINGAAVIEIPRFAQLLGVEFQDARPVLWALVRPTETLEKRRFKIVQTGEHFSDEHVKKYIGTMQTRSSLGFYVTHVFEVRL